MKQQEKKILIIGGVVPYCEGCNTTAGMAGCEKHRDFNLNPSRLEKTTIDDDTLNAAIRLSQQSFFNQ